MRITKVYTRTGDKGQTRLVGGQVVRKSHVRIESYGTVDELNSVLGIVRVFLAEATQIETRADASSAPGAAAVLDPMLHRIQNDLFCVGADLATLTADRWEGMVRVTDQDIARLEGWIDRLNDELEPLKEFVLPGGGRVGAFFHQARTVCRRAERGVVRLLDEDPELDATIMQYLNRLSDWLFVAGRWASRRLGEREVLWER